MAISSVLSVEPSNLTLCDGSFISCVNLAGPWDPVFQSDTRTDVALKVFSLMKWTLTSVDFK